VRQPPSDLVPLFEPTVARVLRAEGADFLRELSHLVVEGWLKNGRVEPFVREMVAECARRRGEFLVALRRDRREELRLLKEEMLSLHPDLGDPERFPKLRGRPHEDYSPGRFDELLSRDDLSRDEYEPAVRFQGSPYDRERSVEGYLLAILSEWELELGDPRRDWSQSWGRPHESRRAGEWLAEERDLYDRDVREYVDWKLVAPEVAMLELCVGLQGLNWRPELARLGLEREDVIDAGLAALVGNSLHGLLYGYGDLGAAERKGALEEVAVLKGKLERAWDGLRARFASTFAAQTVVQRFKTRVEEYDRERTRGIAEQEISRVEAAKEAGERTKSRLEDVLARDLNLYLYDEGHRVLYRPRLDDLEPDALALGPTPLLVEAKAYRDGSRARRDVKDGFAQCVSYLSQLSSSGAAGVYEAHLAVFRVDGPLYELPEVFRHGRFRVYPVLIDLALPEERGRDQARSGVSAITEEEIREHVDGCERKETASGGEATGEGR
jgi:hypothetical protein